MKRILLLFIVAGLLFSVPLNAHPGAQAAEQPGILRVGHTTMFNGNFFLELWGNNTADIDVRSLLHGYPLVAQTRAGGYEIDKTVVSHVERTAEKNGDVTYQVTLNTGLQYSDGSYINARDYLFSFLLLSSPQIKALTGLTPSFDHIVGFEAYHSGSTNVFSGLRLLDDFTFSLRIKNEFLPYYYELAYININPYPISYLTPASRVMDSGKGAYIQGDMSVDTLYKFIMGHERSYMFHPMVTSGPYRLTFYDTQAHVVEFEINPYYLGNYEGQKPQIPRLRFQQVRNQDIHQLLAQGEIDLVNKVTDGDVINQALALEKEGVLALSSYPRTGAAYLAIANERPITSSVNVRQALAFCLDYDVLPRDFLKGHGEKIHGYYGLGQWMVDVAGKDIDLLPHYQLDLDKAAQLLTQDGWMYTQDGGKYRQGDAGLRYRKTASGTYEPLRLKMIVTLKNKAAQMVADMLSENLGKIGGELVQEEMAFDQALRQYYRQEERTYDLLFLGSNFLYFFDPSGTYRVGEEYQGILNTSGLQDKKLADLAAAVTHVPSRDREAFMNKWMNFQIYWAEVLPMIPLYSNTYYDLFTPDLTDYHPENFWNWGAAILYATLNR